MPCIRSNTTPVAPLCAKAAVAAMMLAVVRITSPVRILVSLLKYAVGSLELADVGDNHLHITVGQTFNGGHVAELPMMRSHPIPDREEK
jgi:hypothetical protein